MSDTKECCVCYEPTEHSTPCNHLVCESCFPRVSHCPLCRTPFNNGVAPIEFSDGGPDDESDDEPVPEPESEPEPDYDIEGYDEMTTEAEAGRENNIRQMLDHGGLYNYNWAMREAARHGHESIVRLLLDHSADNFDIAMAYAAVGGHEPIVRLMLGHGATDIAWTIAEARYHGHENIVELIQERMNSPSS